MTMHPRAATDRTFRAFFTLVLVLSLPFWLAALLLKRVNIPINLPISALMAVCPLIAAAILLCREQGWAGVRALLKRTFDFVRIRHKAWYLPVFGLWPLMMLLAYGLMRFIGAPLPDPQVPLRLAPLFFAVFFLSGATEQLGFQGFLYERMQSRRSALSAALLIGVFWGLWHVVPFLQQQRPPAWILWQVLGMVPFRVLIVWLFNNTGSSVFATVIFQAMANVSQFLFPNLGSHYDPLYAFLLMSAAAAAVTFLWGPATLARYRFAPESSGGARRPAG